MISNDEKMAMFYCLLTDSINCIRGITVVPGYFKITTFDNSQTNLSISHLELYFIIPCYFSTLSSIYILLLFKK